MVTFVVGRPVEGELEPPGKLVTLMVVSSAAPCAQDATRARSNKAEYTPEADGACNAGIPFFSCQMMNGQMKWNPPCAKQGACLKREVEEMPKFVIEREIPRAGQLTPEQLKAVSQTSCGVLREMGPQIQWIHSYVTDNKIYCLYIAPDEETVRKHAQMGGFPANSVAEVRAVIDPTTSE
jgi:hypothetical protein